LTPKFSIQITTKNRLEALQFTLQKIAHLLERNDVECCVYDDGSSDGTSDFIKTNYPKIILNRNEKSLGLIHCRNKMLNQTQAAYAISIDDDLHFVTENPLELIENYFEENPKVALLSFRIFWNLKEPNITHTKQKAARQMSFAGGANVWKIAYWKQIPNYPDWFVFYGEEDFAAYQLFKKNYEIHYFPEILVNHRVDLQARKKNKDFITRSRRSLRNGWFLYVLFYPFKIIPRKWLASVWNQLKNKTFRGDFKATIAIFLAMFDILIYLPKLLKNRNALSSIEYKTFVNLPETKLYWTPEND